MAAEMRLRLSSTGRRSGFVTSASALRLPRRPAQAPLVTAQQPAVAVDATVTQARGRRAPHRANPQGASGVHFGLAPAAQSLHGPGAPSRRLELRSSSSPGRPPPPTSMADGVVRSLSSLVVAADRVRQAAHRRASEEAGAGWLRNEIRPAEPSARYTWRLRPRCQPALRISAPRSAGTLGRSPLARFSGVGADSDGRPYGVTKPARTGRRSDRSNGR
jgi:hypothetical protein